MNENLKLVREIYAAFAAGDLQRFFRLPRSRNPLERGRGIPLFRSQSLRRDDALASGVFER
jgi:hypothetical protein